MDTSVRQNTFDPFNPPERIIHFSTIAKEKAWETAQPTEAEYLCQLAEGVEPEKSYDGKAWTVDIRDVVNCSKCLEWLHA
jgi:hypothetical protein